MNNIKIFDTPDDIRKHIEDNKVKLLGFGAEGCVYLSKDNNTLKEYRESYELPYDKEVITTGDFNLETFIFPEELYLHNDLIYGYKAKYFENDILCDIYREKEVEIDLKKLLEARRKVLDDIRVLTDAGYGLDDVYGNVLFDGEQLAIIDTISYLIDDSSFFDNVSKLDRALNLKLYKIDNVTTKWNVSFVDKVKLLIKKNKTSKILVPPIDV